jgi:hypothetical protein
MPPEFFIFLDLVNNNLFYSEDNITVFESRDFERAKLTLADVSRSNRKLVNDKIIIENRICDIPKDAVIPTQTKDKEALFSLFSALRLAGELSKAKQEIYIFRLASRDSFFAYYEKYKSPKQTGTIIFDKMNGSIMSGKEKYVPQTNIRRELLKILWENRRVEDKAGIARKGTPWPKESLAVQIGLTTENRDYPRANKAFRSEMSQLNRIFKEKQMPLKLTMTGGVLMTEQK